MTVHITSITITFQGGVKLPSKLVTDVAQTVLSDPVCQ